MSLFIKGLDMPENDEARIIAILSTGEVLSVYYDEDNRELGLCRPGGNISATSVPTPHGRLIDADAIFEQWYRLNFDRKISDGTLAYWNVLLGKAPTVIEAEEG